MTTGPWRSGSPNDGRCFRVLRYGKEALRCNSLSFFLDGALVSGPDEETISI
jgi:hypothetical protein